MTMSAGDRKVPPDKVRPESQPHGTTSDQIHEMESEGQGGTAKDDAKPTFPPPPNRTAAVSIPGRTVVK